MRYETVNAMNKTPMPPITPAQIARVESIYSESNASLADTPYPKVKNNIIKPYPAPSEITMFVKYVLPKNSLPTKLTIIFPIGEAKSIGNKANSKQTPVNRGMYSRQVNGD